MSDTPTQAKTEKKEPRKERRQRWKGSHKRMSMPAALRTVGLDEAEVAFQLDRLITAMVKLGNDKLRFEVLKECGKLLEAYPANQDVSAELAPQLIIDIPRQSRRIPAPETSNTPAVSRASN
jgi:hypothetical protein